MTNNTAVIGDIHGCLESFTSLLEIILPKADTLVLLGDYVDRGPHSKEVIDQVLQLKKSHPRIIPLMGNHDYMFLQYLSCGQTEPFLQVGGRETLTSYDLRKDTDHSLSSIPKEHAQFLQHLPLYHEDEHAIYVHAGLEPGKHLSMQRAEWCLWARENFLQKNYNFGKPVIFGHTTFRQPHITNTCIGIDTGAVYGGSLTALLFPELEFIRVPGEKNSPYPFPG